MTRIEVDADLMVDPRSAQNELAARAWEIGSEVAAAAADDVDQQARFPHESVAALKQARMFSALVPAELGGGGYGIGSVAGAVRALAYHCSATALVYAMHSTEVIGVCEWGRTAGIEAFVADLVADQLLIANANSEVGVGSAPGRSICCLERGEGRWSLDKQALAISYGAYADAIVATARRTPDSPESDQVLVLARRPHVTVEPTSTWDTIGLRGTCSNSFRLIASGADDLIFPASFPEIAAGGLLHAGQILLSSVWLGLAEAAVGRVHEVVRRAARKNIGVLPPSASRLAELTVDLTAARSMIAAAVAAYEAARADGTTEQATHLVAFRNLKIATSTIAVDLASRALAVCGIASYRRDSPQSFDRLIRDAHGGLVMVSNDRNRDLNAQLLTASKRL